jgi:hypothetical protein
MTDLRQYLSEIGRRGGTRSRRTLSPEAARRMVAIREARRAARSEHVATSKPVAGSDTSSKAQAVQDVLLKRMSPARKLALVASLSRAVDALARDGVRRRYPHAHQDEVRWQLAVLRLGEELASRAYQRPDE